MRKEKKPETMKMLIKKIAVVACAATLAFSMIPATVQAAGWKQNKNGYLWQENDYSYPKNQWKTIYGKQYHFNSGGYMDTGWTKIDGRWYYLGARNDGAKKTYWQKVYGKYYWLGSNGVMRTGWQKVYGKYYWLGGSNDGAMKTGWQKVGKYYYWLGHSNDGAMKTGWQTIYGKKYYLGGANDGAMKTGWQQISGYWYYFGGADDGSLKTNTWIGNYYVDGNGRWTKTRKTDKQILSEFISGGNYKRYTNGYSNLSYAIADLNADSVPELLIESKTEASGFYVTWVFTLDKNKNVVPVKVEDSELVLEEYASYGYGQFGYSQKYKAVIVSTTFRSNSNLGDIPFYKLQGTSLKHSFNIVWDKWDNPSNYRYDSNGNKTEITKSEIEVYKQELIDFSWTQFGSWTKSYSETDESQPVVQSANESENQNESPVVIPEETQGDEQNGEQNLEQDENKEVEQDTKVEQDAEIQEDEEIQADEEISEQPSEESQSAETQKTEEQVDE